MGDPRLETDIGRAGDAACEAQDVISPRERSMTSLKFGYIRAELEGTAGCVLELGCGDGKHVRSLEAISDRLKLYGCDIALEVLSAARHVSKNIIFVSADATRLHFKTERFDAVLSWQNIRILPG